MDKDGFTLSILCHRCSRFNCTVDDARLIFKQSNNAEYARSIRLSVFLWLSVLMKVRTDGLSVSKTVTDGV